MRAYEKVIEIAKAEEGYMEKKSNKDLDSKTANAGHNNYTKYAKDLYPDLQAQAWCDMFVDWCFVKAFGKVDARRLLCGGFSAYTPTSAQYFKDRKQWFTKDPKPGDQIFFKNSYRINHTGLVTSVTPTMVYTTEGNTNPGVDVVENGGQVAPKSYAKDNLRIAGYGRPDWSLVEVPEYELGWHEDSNGWWYADSETTYYQDTWKIINKHKYYFNKDGYAVKGWQEIGEKWYYFEPRKGHPFECAVYATAPDNSQDVAEF